MSRAALEALAERIEAGANMHNREFAELARILGMVEPQDVGTLAVTILDAREGSLDAAVALAERVVGWVKACALLKQSFEWLHADERPKNVRDLALAFVLAVCRARLAELST